MRDITHVVSGLAAASCFPHVVAAAAGGDPVYFILATAAALAPDWLDVHVGRPAFSADVHIVPDPLNPDPRVIAAGLVAAIERCDASGEPLRVKLHSVPLRAGEWRSYTVTFEPARDSVTVRYGATVDARGASTQDAVSAPFATTGPVCRWRLRGMAEARIDSPDGMGLLLEPGGTGRVLPLEDPWRRTWTHGLACALAAGALAFLVRDTTAGLMVAAVVLLHALADSAGYEGVAFLHPWRKGAARGMCRVRREGAPSNLLVLWGCGALVFWNLQSAQAPDAAWRPDWMPYWVVVLTLPLFLRAVAALLARLLPARIFVDRSGGAA